MTKLNIPEEIKKLFREAGSRGVKARLEKNTKAQRSESAKKGWRTRRKKK